MRALTGSGGGSPRYGVRREWRGVRLVVVGDVGEALDEAHDVRGVVKVVLGLAGLAPHRARKHLRLGLQGHSPRRRRDHLEHVLVGPVVAHAQDEVRQVAPLLHRGEDPLRHQALAYALQ